MSGQQQIQAAYVFVLHGTRCTEILELDPAEVTTVGRVDSNRVVLADERCSRFHCEFRHDKRGWFVHDLGSSNGTRVRGERIDGEYVLADGDVVQIGKFGMGFTLDISKSFSVFLSEQDSVDTAEPAFDVTSEVQIVDRRQRSRFEVGSDDGEESHPHEQLYELYRLGLAMGAADGIRQLSDVVLDGLLTRTGAGIGSILLFSNPLRANTSTDKLRLMAYKSRTQENYELVSEQLTNAVLTGHAAVLATDVYTSSLVSDSESLQALEARSVICAPIRTDNILCGLIHVYATTVDEMLDGDDLDFILAVANQFALSLKHLLTRDRIVNELQSAKAINNSLRQHLEIDSDLVGESESVIQLKQSIGQVAPTSATVLIGGESGVGKELVARAIHFNSAHKERPLICMNCAALTESLLESELFGHEQGAFTGATERKIGKFEQANHGTLFLDEIGEMSLEIQAKFLRVLEGHPFERVGGNSPIKVDVRVVAATNRDLVSDIENNRFRRDLYFRLNVFEILVQPLRERSEDIPLLAQHFLDRYSKEFGRAVQGFQPAAMDALMSYHWPGNVRELQNVIERSVILCTKGLIEPTHIRLSEVPSLSESDGDSAVGAASLDEVEREHIRATLRQTGWNKSEAARILNIGRTTLDRKIERYSLTES